MADKKTGAGRGPRDPHNDTGKGRKGEESSRPAKKDSNPGSAGKADKKGLK